HPKVVIFQWPSEFARLFFALMSTLCPRKNKIQVSLLSNGHKKTRFRGLRGWLIKPKATLDLTDQDVAVQV
ncbi:hypothetical protein, partial [Pectobacterium versatile]|uniref:hypothetical protein n=1 Tax=Pectobacterium versatile TaxID=2488639 RepID=UPI001B395B53